LVFSVWPSCQSTFQTASRPASAEPACSVKDKKKMGGFIYSAYPTLPVNLGAESRVCYPGHRQPQWELTYSNSYLSQSTANQNQKLIHCHRWGLNLQPLAHKCTSLTTQLSPTPTIAAIGHSRLYFEKLAKNTKLNQKNPHKNKLWVWCVMWTNFSDAQRLKQCNRLFGLPQHNFVRVLLHFLHLLLKRLQRWLGNHSCVSCTSILCFVL
jgi:hypothetical protein